MSNMPYRPMPRQPEPLNANNRMALYFREESRLREKSSFRLILLSLIFLMAFLLITLKLTFIAGSKVSISSGTYKMSREIESRHDIVDRNGNILATNIPVNSLYAHPNKLLDAKFAAESLSLIFPEMKAEEVLRLFEKNPKFVFLKGSISEVEKNQILELGEPGLKFGDRELRLYPNGPLLAHVLGRTQIKEMSSKDVRLEGVSGLEKMFDNALKKYDFEQKPLKLSIDLATQSILEDVLSDGIDLFKAKGGTGIIMEVNNGEILGMVSFPNFDPNFKPESDENSTDNKMLFNKAVQGTYELGSVLKIFTAAMAIELGAFSPHTMIDVSKPVKIGNTKPIKDKTWLGDKIPLKEVIAKSSNVGSARIISNFRPEEQKEFLENLGFFEETGVELPEANVKSSIGADPWTNYKAAMIAIGHGIRISPLHLATAYAISVNGGFKIKPTIIKGINDNFLKKRVISHDTSTKIIEILGEVVNSGTGQNAQINGYSVGGKTGTAEKFDRGLGKFNFEKNYASFASFFPLNEPKYVVVICLDEASNQYRKTNQRIAGNTAVPLAAEIISRVAPILGIMPEKHLNTAADSSSNGLISDISNLSNY